MMFHAAANIFPKMGPAEFEALKQDIRQHGQRVPIELWQGKVLDGRHRYEACRELGIEPTIKVLADLPAANPYEYVASANLHRRHLSSSQRAMVAARLRRAFDEAAARRRAQSRGALSQCASGKARDQAGALVGVSGRSVDSASKVLRLGDSTVVRACERGELAVATAAKLVELPRAAQRAALEQGRQGVVAAIRQALRPSEWPLSDELTKLFEEVTRLERAISTRFKTLESMAKAEGYDRRLLGVHRHQLHSLAKALLALLECANDLDLRGQNGSSSAPAIPAPLIHDSMSARRRSVLVHDDGKN